MKNNNDIRSAAIPINPKVEVNLDQQTCKGMIHGGRYTGYMIKLVHRGIKTLKVHTSVRILMPSGWVRVLEVVTPMEDYSSITDKLKMDTDLFDAMKWATVTATILTSGAAAEAKLVEWLNM